MAQNIDDIYDPSSVEDGYWLRGWDDGYSGRPRVYLRSDRYRGAYEEGYTDGAAFCLPRSFFRLQ